jgi:ribosomal protein S12 methylthiotransferase
LVEKQRESLLESRPEIDALVGVFGREEVARVADRLLGNLSEQRLVFRPAPIQALPDRDRFRITPRHFAYLKISEGCDRLCTFCAIPGMRGKHASKPVGDVVDEARELVADGVRELIIVAQDTTYYGIDLYGEPRLAALLRQLDQIDGLDWIRLMYFYPMYVTDALLETMASSRRILPYVDMPLQHINDVVLRRMARRVTRHGVEELLDRLRQAVPGVVLRTTFITGFPGETAAQFDELNEFVAVQRFDHVGVFAYSYEADTPAAQLPGHLPDRTRQQRRARLMETQQPIAFERVRQMVGQQRDVILDCAVDGEPNVWIGRTMADAPDVDGVVYVTGGEIPLAIGCLVPCEIVDARGYDAVAVAVGSPR